MNQLQKAVEFVTTRMSKEAIKNLSLFLTVPLATTATAGLVATSSMNGKLQENLNAKEAEATELASELSSAQETIDELNSQFATASSKVTSDIVLNGRGDATGKGGVLTNDTALATDGSATGGEGADGKTTTSTKNGTKTTLTTEEVKNLQDENKKLQDENKALTDTVNKLESSSNNGSSNTTNTATQNRLNSLSTENATLSSQVDNLQAENEDLKSENEALRNTVNTLANSSSDSDKAYEDLSNLALSLADENAKLGEQNNQLTSEYNDLAEELASVSSQLNGYKESLVATSKSLSDAKNSVNLLTNDVSDLQTELEKTQEQLEKVTTSYNELDGSIDSAALLEVYRENVDDINSQISAVEKQIADIEKKEVWSELDKARYDTLSARIEAGDDSLASFEDMANEMADLLAAHTYTDEDTQKLIDLNAKKTELETSLAEAQATLEEAETQWLTSDPKDSLAAISATDKALREKIETLNADIETKQAELEEAQKEAESYAAEMYRLKESIETLEAQYNELALEEKLHGSYEDGNGNINFELQGSEEYNGVVSAIESIITSLKNRINELVQAIEDASGDIEDDIPDSEIEIDDEGHKVISSKLIHKKVSITLFKGTEKQVKIKGEMPYGQITKTSTSEDGTTSANTYFGLDENGESNGKWDN